MQMRRELCCVVKAGTADGVDEREHPHFADFGYVLKGRCGAHSAMMIVDSLAAGDSFFVRDHGVEIDVVPYRCGHGLNAVSVPADIAEFVLALRSC